MSWIGDLLKQLTMPAAKTSDASSLPVDHARAAVTQVPVKWLCVYEFVHLEKKERDCLTVWAIDEKQARDLARQKVAYVSGRILSVTRIVS